MDPIQPILANALTFAFEKATIEGKITISALILVSMVSWSVIITKGRQILKARAMSKKFLAAYRDAKDPMSLFREKQEFSGAPAFEVYAMGCGEVEYHLENNPVTVKGQKRISVESFQSVQVALERAVSTEALSLEKGMIILTTAVAGGPFIGLLGTVWGVMKPSPASPWQPAPASLRWPRVSPAHSSPPSSVCSSPSRPCSPTT